MANVHCFILPNGKLLLFMSNLYLNNQKVILDSNIKTYSHTQNQYISDKHTKYQLFDLPSTTLACYYIHATSNKNGYSFKLHLGEEDTILSGETYSNCYMFCINQSIGTVYQSQSVAHSYYSNKNNNSMLYCSSSIVGATISIHIFGFYIA